MADLMRTIAADTSSKEFTASETNSALCSPSHQWAKFWLSVDARSPASEQFAGDKLARFIALEKGDQLCDQLSSST